jgi:hypothetical protein
VVPLELFEVAVNPISEIARSYVVFPVSGLAEYFRDHERSERPVALELCLAEPLIDRAFVREFGVCRRIRPDVSGLLRPVKTRFEVNDAALGST